MHYSSQIQSMKDVVKENLRKQITAMGVGAGKPMEITDDVMTDIAIVCTLGVLSGQRVDQAFAVAYQLAFAVQNED